MLRWFLRFGLLTLAALAVGLPISGQNTPSAPVEGTVSQAYRLTFPRVRLVLQLADGKRVIGEPVYQYKNDTIDLTDMNTIENLGCYYWLPGDRVRARLSRQEATDNSYLFTEVRRLAGGRVAIPNRPDKPEPRPSEEKPEAEPPAPKPEPDTPAKTPAPEPQKPLQPKTEEPVKPEPKELTVKITTDKSAYAPGETVRIRLTLKNNTESERQITFPSGQRFEITAEREGRKVWQWSHGKMFIMAFGNLRLGPGQSFAAEERWDQKDNDGQPVPQGTYTLSAWITARQLSDLPQARTTFRIGTEYRSMTTIREILDEPDRYLGKRVGLQGRYRGWKPDPEAPHCKMGPPVTRSDWAIEDDTGTLYVTGKSVYDPVEDIGKPLRLEATVLKNEEKGQIYLRSEKAVKG
ncbi:MAG: hypothetical protein IT210_17320 [Armatimonadetes bacterium]|nr:hypothetical protein [Armatimonadota bacterium]